MNTGARVTYAMGKDDELSGKPGLAAPQDADSAPRHLDFGGDRGGPRLHRFPVLFGNAGALSDATIKALPQGFWSSFGYMSHDTMAALPNSLLTVDLSSNFGTFLLYA